MKRLWALGLVVLFGRAGGATAQVPSNDESAPLVLVRIIAMPDVQGRFDHMGVDNKTNRVFAAVYGNDSVEVLDVARGRRLHSIQAEFVVSKVISHSVPTQNPFNWKRKAPKSL